MTHTKILSLEGKDSKALPKYIVRFSGSSSLYINSFEDAIKASKEENLIIESIQPIKLDPDLFETSACLIDETKSLLNVFSYAINGRDDLSDGVEKKFFAFFELIKTIEKKVSDIKVLYQNNYEAIEFSKRNTVNLV